MNEKFSPLMSNLKGAAVNSPRGETTDEEPTLHGKGMPSDDDIMSQMAQEEAQQKVDAGLSFPKTDDDDKPPTPEELEKQYLKGLEYVGLTKEQAVEIMDDILFKELHTKDFVICNRIPVTLGTRGYRDVQRASRLIEAEAPSVPIHVNDLIARFNVAASLRKYGDRVFDFPAPDSENKVQDEAFFERLDFVMQKPSIIVENLISLAAEFDMMVRAVFAKGAPENF